MKIKLGTLRKLIREVVNGISNQPGELTIEYVTQHFPLQVKELDNVFRRDDEFAASKNYSLENAGGSFEFKRIDEVFPEIPFMAEKSEIIPKSKLCLCYYDNNYSLVWIGDTWDSID